MSGTVWIDRLETPLSAPIRLDEAVWLDEAGWSDVEQTTSYALSGSLFVEGGTKLAGRTMTIGGDNCWATWSQCKQLVALSNECGLKLHVLLEDGRAFTVLFRHGDGDCVEVARLYERQPQDGDWCRLTLRFLILSEG